MKVAYLAGVLFWSAATAPSHSPQSDTQLHPKSAADVTDAAQISEPPSGSKLALIRRFLRLNGTQAEIDSGSFLDRYGLPGGPVGAQLPSSGDMATFRDLLIAPMEALRRAYQLRREAFQEAYEAHVNWEFTEDELTEIVRFLETPAGRHFLVGRWRMDAYVGTEMEQEVEEIIQEARRDLNARR